MRDLFAGYGLLLPVLIGNAVAQALIAVPCAIASRFSKKAGTFVWVSTLAVLFVGGVAYILTSETLTRDWWRTGVLLAIALIGPQVLAYPLGRNRPGLIVGAAFGFGIAIALAWIILGGLSGSTPD